MNTDYERRRHCPFLLLSFPFTAARKLTIAIGYQANFGLPARGKINPRNAFSGLLCPIDLGRQININTYS